VTLRAPTLEECEQVRLWRNAPDVLPMLRTKEPLTAEQQAAFYWNVVANPLANHRYYALEVSGQFIGLGGLTHLDRRPGEAEISLIIAPEWRARGLGLSAVDALTREAFGPMGLTAIIGECYEKSSAREFWNGVLKHRPPVSRSWRWER